MKLERLIQVPAPGPGAAAVRSALAAAVTSALAAAVVVILSALLATLPALATEVPFTEHIVDGSFDGARSLAIADVDGDGDLDVLGAAQDAGDITWWENSAGDGTAWTEHSIDDSFPDAASVAVADVDGDGDLDVLGAAAGSDDEITWWENTAGDGTAWAERTVDGDFGATQIVAADVDGDGDLDVLGAASGTDDEITWWKNTAGDGTAWAEQTVDDDFDGAVSVATADMDGDGDLDVLGAAGIADDITWWEQRVPCPPCITIWIPHTVDGDFDGARSVAAADVDGDGDLDVLGAASIGDQVTWWENTTGDGTAWAEHTVDGDFDGAVTVTAADVDGDGDLDVLGTASVDDECAWWENTAGDGTAWIKHTVDGSFPNAFSVAAADVDGDGDLDVLGTTSLDDGITWWENETIHRSAIYPTRHTVEGDFDGAFSVAAADVDGDGDLDVLGTANLANEIRWWENTASDGSAWTEHTVDGDFSRAVSVAAADVDGDGDLDVLGAASLDDEEITWWENTEGDGTAWTEHTVDGDFNGNHVVAADVDGDGDIDVLGADFFGDDITWWENTAGNGIAWTEHTVDGSFDGADSVATADVDGDGDLDVLGAGISADAIKWWENTASDGTAWTVHIVDGSFDGATSVATADMDGDGDIDVLGAATFAGDITWWERRVVCPPCIMIWFPHTVDDDFDGARSATAADVDGDGDMDVLAAALADDDITWWENTAGDGTAWTEHTVDGSFDGSISVTAADLDGDGDLDLLGAARQDDDIAWWPNLGGQFGLATADTAPPGPVAPGTEDDLLSIAMSHLGRSGDHHQELATLDLLFEETAGDPLTTMEANATIQSLEIYRDTGSGVFEMGSDTLVATVGTLALTAGRQTVTLTDGDPNVQVAFGTSALFFVVLEFESTNRVGKVDSLRVSHLTTSSSTGEDRANDIQLVLEFVADVASSVVDTSTLPVELMRFSID